MKTFALPRTAMTYRIYPLGVVEDGTETPATATQVLFLPLGERPTLLDESLWVAGDVVTGEGTRVLYAGPDVPSDAVGYDGAVVVPLEGLSVFSRVVDNPERLMAHLEDVRVF